MAQQAAVGASRGAHEADVGPSRADAIRYRTGLWLLLAPFLLGTAVLVGLPALLTFALAFTDFDALSPPYLLTLKPCPTVAGPGPLAVTPILP